MITITFTFIRILDKNAGHSHEHGKHPNLPVHSQDHHIILLLLQHLVLGTKRSPDLSKVNITFNLRSPGKSHCPHYAWALFECVIFKLCHIRKCFSKRAELFCHNHHTHHFVAFGDFTAFPPISPGLVSLASYVMIFRVWEMNSSLCKIWQGIYTPKLL